MADKAAHIPTATFFKKFPWASSFSVQPGSPLGDLLSHETKIHGELMLPSAEVEKYLTTMRRLVDLMKRRKNMN
jgi:hypothetical protein